MHGSLGNGVTNTRIIREREKKNLNEFIKFVV